MLRKILFLLFSGILVCNAQNLERYLLPTPKQVKISGRFTAADKTFKLVNGFGKELKSGKLELFCQTLKERLGWQMVNSAKQSIILKKLSSASKDPEFYTLETAPGRITISARTGAGIMRGISRLLSMTNTPLIKVIGNKVELTQMKIADYPDNPKRIFQVNLRQVFAKSPKKLLLETANLLIDRAAELQFNSVMLVIGGSMKLDGHPEINPYGPVFTKDEIRSMVKRAKQRGLECWPLINSIGHASAAPWICPIYDKTGKKVIGIDVTDPKFDKLFFRYIDELAELFPGASVFGIGTDEFHRVVKQIEKNSGKKCEEFYPEYANKVSRHLKKYNMRTLIYHDMMGPGGRYKWPIETLNGPKGAMEMLKKFDKDIIVGYWNYFHAYDYPFVKDLREAGFKELWMIGWYCLEPIKALYQFGHKLKTPLFTTHWSAIPAKNEFVHGAEFSWNSGKSQLTQDDFNDVNNFYYYSRPLGNLLDAETETVKLTGGYPLFAGHRKKLAGHFHGTQAVSSGVPVNFSYSRSFSARLPELKTVPLKNIPELAKKNELKNYVIFTGNSINQRIIGRKSGVNEKREKGKLIFYTPAHGKTTGTNNRGVEFSVNNSGKILELSGNCTGRSGDEKGNFTIPADGLTVSWHEAQPCFFFRSYTFYQTLRKGDTLKLMRRNLRGMTRNVINGKFSAPRTGAAVFLQPVNPADPGRLAQVIFHLADGSKKRVTVKGSDFISAPCELRDTPAWDQWIAFPMVRYGFKPMLAVEWNQPAGAPLITGISVQSSHQGVDSGLSVLGVTAWSRKNK